MSTAIGYFPFVLIINDLLQMTGMRWDVNITAQKETLILHYDK
jgi:hypothetical protein